MWSDLAELSGFASFTFICKVWFVGEFWVFFLASFDFSLLWPVLAELITRFARYGFASEFQVYSQIVAWLVLARVSGASEALSVLNFGCF